MQNQAQNESNAGGTSKVNEWKQEFTRAVAPPVPAFRPLTCWPFKPHDRQAEMDAYAGINSIYNRPA